MLSSIDFKWFWSPIGPYGGYTDALKNRRRAALKLKIANECFNFTDKYFILNSIFKQGNNKYYFNVESS